MYHNVRAIELWHKLSNAVFIPSFEVSSLVEGAQHDLVTYVKFDLFAMVLVSVVSLVDLGFDEIVVCLCCVVRELCNDLGSVNLCFVTIYKVRGMKGGRIRGNLPI